MKKAHLYPNFDRTKLLDIEELAALVHKAYCEEYELKHGVPYWTNGDYNKLDEKVKSYDRATVRAVIGGISPEPEDTDDDCQEFYNIHLLCTNCHHKWKENIPKGMQFLVTRNKEAYYAKASWSSKYTKINCPNCDCNTVRSETWDETNRRLEKREDNARK